MYREAFDMTPLIAYIGGVYTNRVIASILNSLHKGFIIINSKTGTYPLNMSFFTPEALC